MMGPIDNSELDRIDIIKSGHGGTIYKVKHNSSGQFYALKVFNNDISDDIREQIMSEIEKLREIDHPNFVTIHEVFHHNGEIQVLLEYMDGGSLQGAYIPDEAALSELSFQILSILAYLHSRQIVHFDLKPSNILVKSLNEVKLGYFGVRNLVDPEYFENLCNSYMATASYHSPDKLDGNFILEGGEYDWYDGNIWSFGLIIWEFYIGRYPIVAEGYADDFVQSFVRNPDAVEGYDYDRDKSFLDLMCCIVKLQPFDPQNASPELQDFITCCLQIYPETRWSAEQLLLHPFITLPQFNDENDERSVILLNSIWSSN